MDLTIAQVGAALAGLGNYRVKRAQLIAGEQPAGTTDTVSGALVLALGLRETRLRNIEGGAKLQNGHWVPQDNPVLMDVGFAQINRAYHHDALKLMRGVRTGTWTPMVAGKTAADAGYVPRFEEQLRFVVRELHDALAYAEQHNVPVSARIRFAVAAHNAGLNGALDGIHAGDVDKHTTHGDYSAWVLRHRILVAHWINQHLGWQA